MDIVLILIQCPIVHLYLIIVYSFYLYKIISMYTLHSIYYVSIYNVYISNIYVGFVSLTYNVSMYIYVVRASKYVCNPSQLYHTGYVSTVQRRGLHWCTLWSTRVVRSPHLRLLRSPLRCAWRWWPWASSVRRRT